MNITDDVVYKEKYFKYKNKYVKLKNNMNEQIFDTQFSMGIDYKTPLIAFLLELDKNDSFKAALNDNEYTITYNNINIDERVATISFNVNRYEKNNTFYFYINELMGIGTDISIILQVGIYNYYKKFYLPVNWEKDKLKNIENFKNFLLQILKDKKIYMI
jgi:hypothetical protein